MYTEVLAYMDRYIDTTYSWTTCLPYEWNMNQWDCTLEANVGTNAGRLWAACGSFPDGEGYE